MVKAFFKLLFRLRGWKLHQPTPPEAFNCIMVAAPHTSNWDFPYTMTALELLGVNPKFTIKEEFNRFPFSKLMERMGALWIDRSPRDGRTDRRSMTEVFASLFEEHKDTPMSVVVTPEGTRSKVKQWKTGFYYSALKANVPICLAFMDYEKNITGVGMCFKPSGDLEADMKIIMDFYRDKQGKFPQQFALDTRYS